MRKSYRNLWMFLTTKVKNKSQKQSLRARFLANLNRSSTLRRTSSRNRTTPFISRPSPNSSTIRRPTRTIATSSQLRTPPISKATSINRTTSSSRLTNISKTNTSSNSSSKLKPTNTRKLRRTNTKLNKINMRLSKISTKLRLQLLSTLSQATLLLPTLKAILTSRSTVRSRWGEGGAR